MSESILLLLTILGVADATRCTYYSYYGYSRVTYCSHGCCDDDSSNPCCSYYSYSYIYGETVYLSVGAIVGIVFGVLALIGIVSTVVACICCRRRQASQGQVIGNQMPTVSYVSSTNAASSQGFVQPYSPQVNAGFNTGPPQGNYYTAPPT